MATMSSLNSGRDLFAMVLVVLGSMAWAGGSLVFQIQLGFQLCDRQFNLANAGSRYCVCPRQSFLRGMELDKSGYGPDRCMARCGISDRVRLHCRFQCLVWLLKVQPATKVSTYAYVNPVVAVLLGIFFAHESVTPMQISGLIVILGSVLLINLSQIQKA